MNREHFFAQSVCLLFHVVAIISASFSPDANAQMEWDSQLQFPTHGEDVNNFLAGAAKSPNPKKLHDPEAFSRVDVLGATAQSRFGQFVSLLPNGNIVIWDPEGGTNGSGAVHLYRSNGALISTLTGSFADDDIGAEGITILPSGNIVVASRGWNGRRGAVTWINGTTGLSGAVSASNSLVGARTSDEVGSAGVVVLSNGNYVVRSPRWRSATCSGNCGAVTWVNGNSGITGEVTAANSLTGPSPSDFVGSGGVVPLTNGNYVVISPSWNPSDHGAVTFVRGNVAHSAIVSTSNSLTGSRTGDQVGSAGVVPLANGNYVVGSPLWDNGTVINAGAVTWGSGTAGISGIVSPANSLVGSTNSDLVGQYPVTSLSNGNYVVISPDWDNGSVQNAGAATWANGTTGLAGSISTANSLVGSIRDDFVGGRGVTALRNGNYVVSSPSWSTPDNLNVGAVTWANGSSGRSGPVSAANSLIGTITDSFVGNCGVVALSNGHYVAVSPTWNGMVNGTVFNRIGAVTWGNGSNGIVGQVSAANSVVGAKSGDLVGDDGSVNFTPGGLVQCVPGVVALSNGNYVVSSNSFSNGPTLDGRGAVTWVSGASGTSSVVSSSNSLIGTGTRPGNVTGLSDGNYVVISSEWDNSPLTDVGAVTWRNGSVGTSGLINNANSLVGTQAQDRIGTYGVRALNNGHYVVYSRLTGPAGAVTFSRQVPGISGSITAANSVVDMNLPRFNFIVSLDYNDYTIVIGRPEDDVVSIINFPRGDAIFADDFDN